MLKSMYYFRGISFRCSLMNLTFSDRSLIFYRCHFQEKIMTLVVVNIRVELFQSKTFLLPHFLKKYMCFASSLKKQSQVTNN